MTAHSGRSGQGRVGGPSLHRTEAPGQQRKPTALGEGTLGFGVCTLQILRSTRGLRRGHVRTWLPSLLPWEVGVLLSVLFPHTPDCTWLLVHMVGTHGGQRAEKMSLLGYLSPLTRKPKRRHLSQQKGHPAHWLIPGAGETAGSPLCPPPSGRGWCPLPTVVALGEVLTVCSASVSPSGKWGQGY